MEDNSKYLTPKKVILGLDKKERAIFEVFSAFSNNDGLSRVRRLVIAGIAQCTVRDVARITRKLVELGLLCKSANTPWDSVQYNLNPKLIRNPRSFSLWFNSLSKGDQKFWIDNDMLPDGYMPTSSTKKNSAAMKIRNYLDSEIRWHRDKDREIVKST